MQTLDPKDSALIAKMAADKELSAATRATFLGSCRYRYSYNFKWLGRPIIQYPEDMIAMQEILWETRPELVIETGIAHGGSILYYASLLELIGGEGHVLGIDIEIRDHNRRAIEAHPMAKRVSVIEGSSVAPDVMRKVEEAAKNKERILVILDSNHTHEHVLRELELYAPLVTPGSYIVVFDTVVEFMPDEFFTDRPWQKGNSPYTAVQEYLARTDRFVVDMEIQNKLLLTVAPGGYLKCVRD